MIHLNVLFLHMHFQNIKVKVVLALLKVVLALVVPTIAWYQRLRERLLYKSTYKLTQHMYMHQPGPLINYSNIQGRLSLHNPISHYKDPTEGF